MTRAIATAGLAYYKSRVNMTNKDRLGNALPLDKSLAIASHKEVPMDFRVLAVHRAIDLAYEMPIEDGNAVLERIADILKKKFEEGSTPIGVLERIANAVPRLPAGQWARKERDIIVGSRKQSEEIAA